MKENSEKIAENKTTTTLGMNENAEGALCYIFIFITGIFFFLTEKKSKFVRFHAIQSITTFVPLFIIGFIISLIPIPWLSFIMLEYLKEIDILLWFFLMYKAYINEMFELPIVGKFSTKHSM